MVTKFSLKLSNIKSVKGFSISEGKNEDFTGSASEFSKVVPSCQGQEPKAFSLDMYEIDQVWLKFRGASPIRKGLIIILVF